MSSLWMIDSQGFMLMAMDRWRGFVLLIILLFGFMAELSSSSSPPSNNNRYHSGRHVCMQNKAVSTPTKQVQTYCKPVYKSHIQLCDPYQYKLCTSFRVVYELSYRTVYTMETKNEVLYSCCPGWTQPPHSPYGCMQAVCNNHCQNGGSCNKPDHCNCLPNFTGKTCESALTDIYSEDTEISLSPSLPIPPQPTHQSHHHWPNRPQENEPPSSLKPHKHHKHKESIPCDKHDCSHKCINSADMKTFECGCLDGFVLQSDGKTCHLCLTCNPEFKELMDRQADLLRQIMKLEKVQSEIKNEVTDTRQKYQSLIESTTTVQPPPPPPPRENTIPFNDVQISMMEQLTSLSDQIALLEERLEYCSCKDSDYSRRRRRHVEKNKKK